MKRKKNIGNLYKFIFITIHRLSTTDKMDLLKTVFALDIIVINLLFFF